MDKPLHAVFTTSKIVFQNGGGTFSSLLYRSIKSLVFKLFLKGQALGRGWFVNNNQEGVFAPEQIADYCLVLPFKGSRSKGRLTG